MRFGSLFTGLGLLDEGVMRALGGGRLAWFAESPGATAEAAVRMVEAGHTRRQVGRALRVPETGKRRTAAQVGHQDVTLQRLRTYRREVLQLVEAGARVLVCVQLGPMALVEFWREAAGIFPGGCVVPAIPMKKNAVSVAELAAFARAVRPSDCHLLGLGESNARWIQATEAEARAEQTPARQAPAGQVAEQTPDRQTAMVLK